MDGLFPVPGRRRLSRALTAVCVLSAAVYAALAAIPRFFGKDVGAGYAAVDKSLCALAADGSADLLIGGDSRAKQQIIPHLLDSLTGFRSVNVAEAITFGGDLPTLANSLAHYPEALEKAKVLVVSVSVPGYNDLAFDDLPAASVLNWAPMDHLRALLHAPRKYARYLTGAYLPFLKRHVLHRIRGTGYACGDGAPLPSALIAARGFRPDTGTSVHQPPSAPPKAADFLLDGGRRRAFARALDRLAAGPARAIVLYQAPMAPSWRKDPAYAVEVEVEERFGALLAADAARQPKAVFLDFFKSPPAGLADPHFVDNYHLNPEGAAIFTRAVAAALRDSLTDGRPARGIRSGP
jgi:hypothetical protein